MGLGELFKKRDAPSPGSRDVLEFTPESVDEKIVKLSAEGRANVGLDARLMANQTAFPQAPSVQSVRLYIDSRLRGNDKESSRRRSKMDYGTQQVLEKLLEKCVDRYVL
ncbi:MAG: hypothetical protein V1847_00825 [Candidatus Diapherotrites archaeon]